MDLGCFCPFCDKRRRVFKRFPNTERRRIIILKRSTANVKKKKKERLNKSEFSTKLGGKWV